MTLVNKYISTYFIWSWRASYNFFGSLFRKTFLPGLYSQLICHTDEHCGGGCWYEAGGQDRWQSGCELVQGSGVYYGYKETSGPAAGTMCAALAINTRTHQMVPAQPVDDFMIIILIWSTLDTAIITLSILVMNNISVSVVCNICTLQYILRLLLSLYIDIYKATTKLYFCIKVQLNRYGGDYFYYVWLVKPQMFRRSFVKTPMMMLSAYLLFASKNILMPDPLPATVDSARWEWGEEQPGRGVPWHKQALDNAI